MGTDDVAALRAEHVARVRRRSGWLSGLPSASTDDRRHAASVRASADRVAHDRAVAEVTAALAAERQAASRRARGRRAHRSVAAEWDHGSSAASPPPR